MKNIPITIGFAVITVAQCVFGVCMTVLTAREGGKIRSLDMRTHFHSERRSTRRDFAYAAQPQLPIPLDAYHVCEFAQPMKHMEVAYTSLSLFFGGWDRH